MFRLLTLGIAVGVEVAFIFKRTCDNLPRVYGKLPSTSTIQRAVVSASGRLIQTQYCMLWTVPVCWLEQEKIYLYLRYNFCGHFISVFELKFYKLRYDLRFFFSVK